MARLPGPPRVHTQPDRENRTGGHHGRIMRTIATMTAWQQRIVGYEPDADPEQLLAHPLNARRHPGRQRDALRESLGKVGWVDVVKVNTVTGHVVDGHARVEEAITAGEAVPVVYLELDEDEERFVLATLDPISAMAEYDTEVLADLLDGLDIESEGLRDHMKQIAPMADGGPHFGPSDDDQPRLDQREPVTCPDCGYTWRVGPGGGRGAGHMMTQCASCAARGSGLDGELTAVLAVGPGSTPGNRSEKLAAA